MTLSSLPSVDRLLQPTEAVQLISKYGRSLTIKVIRDTLNAARSAIQGGAASPTSEEILEDTRLALQQLTASTLRPVINATGVIVHTNLGRSPLSPAARQAMLEVAEGYNLSLIHI